jgi:NAD(P)-dependent dehydrogenase (short-subunit alcohol dehydrogenase family)
MYVVPQGSCSTVTADAMSWSTPRRWSLSGRSTSTSSVWRRVQAVNVESALLLAQAFAPGMRDRGFGRVIFIVSNTFWNPPGIHMLSYIASKGALIGMARTLAVGLGREGIGMTAVAPGLTRTPATVVVPAEEFADIEAHQALPRPLTPQDTAAVVAMLARDEAAALTGQTLTVDGGLVLR